MRSPITPGILLMMLGGVLIYWSLTKLGLLVPKSAGTATPAPRGSVSPPITTPRVPPTAGGPR